MKFSTSAEAGKLEGDPGGFFAKQYATGAR